MRSDSAQIILPRESARQLSGADLRRWRAARMAGWQLAAAEPASVGTVAPARWLGVPNAIWGSLIATRVLLQVAGRTKCQAAFVRPGESCRDEIYRLATASYRTAIGGPEMLAFSWLHCG
jgi:hypothetical protein